MQAYTHAILELTQLLSSIPVSIQIRNCNTNTDVVGCRVRRPYPAVTGVLDHVDYGMALLYNFMILVKALHQFFCENGTQQHY